MAAQIRCSLQSVAKRAAREEWFVPQRIIERSSSDSGSRLEQVVLTRRVKQGTVVARVFTSVDCLHLQPTWDSLQVGVKLFAKFGGPALKLNHSAAPNVRLSIAGPKESALYPSCVEVIARTDIEPGVALTFNYNTTEWEMAEPFQDWAADDSPAGQVQGFRFLSADEKKRLLSEPGLVAQHICELWAGVESASAGSES